MEEAIVLYPSPALGHLISLVELAKFILSHRPSLSIHILLATPAYASAGSTAPYISAVSAAVPSIKFHHFPTTTLPPTAVPHHETLTFRVLRLSNPHVHHALLDISHTHTICAFIIDFFCTCSIPVASQFSIPTHLYFTSPAGCLASFMYLPTLHEKTAESFRVLNKTLLDIPGIPSLPAADMAKPVLDRGDEAYQYFLDLSISIPKFSGILINTFEVLETRTIKTIRDGLCVPNFPTPPLYCIGPLIAAEDQSKGPRSSPRDEVPECLTWLDSQPSNSVLFLCFGSLGLFSKEQLREIAIGLEKSGQRFLWVVRNPPSDNKSVALSGKTEPKNLESLLPQGFLDRTKDRGFVVKSWAPQVAVLNHDAVGGFVTHCGWNSILEAVRAGVPMVAWPLYAEQRLNRVLLVEEIKIGIPMEESEENGFVSWAEVEKRARELMDSDEGDSVRKRTLAMRDAAKTALSQGGSSLVDLDKFFHSFKRG